MSAAFEHQPEQYLDPNEDPNAYLQHMSELHAGDMSNVQMTDGELAQAKEVYDQITNGYRTIPGKDDDGTEYVAHYLSPKGQFLKEADVAELGEMIASAEGEWKPVGGDRAWEMFYNDGFTESDESDASEKGSDNSDANEGEGGVLLVSDEAKLKFRNRRNSGRRTPSAKPAQPSSDGESPSDEATDEPQDGSRPEPEAGQEPPEAQTQEEPEPKSRSNGDRRKLKIVPTPNEDSSAKDGKEAPSDPQHSVEDSGAEDEDEAPTDPQDSEKELVELFTHKHNQPATDEADGDGDSSDESERSDPPEAVEGEISVSKPRHHQRMERRRKRLAPEVGETAVAAALGSDEESSEESSESESIVTEEVRKAVWKRALDRIKSPMEVAYNRAKIEAVDFFTKRNELGDPEGYRMGRAAAVLGAVALGFAAYKGVNLNGLGGAAKEAAMTSPVPNGSSGSAAANIAPVDVPPVEAAPTTGGAGNVLHGHDDTVRYSSVWKQIKETYHTNNHDTAEMLRRTRLLNPDMNLDRVQPDQGFIMADYTPGQGSGSGHIAGDTVNNLHTDLPKPSAAQLDRYKELIEGSRIDTASEAIEQILRDHGISLDHDQFNNAVEKTLKYDAGIHAALGEPLHDPNHMPDNYHFFYPSMDVILSYLEDVDEAVVRTN